MKNRVKSIIILTLVIFCISTQCISISKTLTGNIEKVWTVDLAREEAFKDAKPWIDLSQYSPTDPEFKENKKLISKNILKDNGKIITAYSDGWYSIKYNNSITESYYYDYEGNLREIDFSIYPYNIYTMDDMVKYPYESLFPIKRYKHIYPGGEISRITIDVKYDKSYSFKPNGELKTYCDGPNCYDSNNQLIMKRSY